MGLLAVKKEYMSLKAGSKRTREKCAGAFTYASTFQSVV